MTPDMSIGRIMTLDETIKYYEQVIEAEKKMGPLTHEEKAVILSNFGKNLTGEELADLLARKRVLVVKGNDEKTSNDRG